MTSLIHPYLLRDSYSSLFRIVKDFYITEPDVGSRPRVFGMTASPIDAKTDVRQAADELEKLLDSRIATTLDMSLTDAVKQRTEAVLSYETLPQPFETRLLQTVKTQYGHVEIFQKIFEASPEIARHLGSWCADQYLFNSLSEERLRRYEIDTERNFYTHSVQRPVEELDRKQAELRSALKFMQKERSKASDIVEGYLSSKVRKLQMYLYQHFVTPSSQRCIVFVERRDTARLLDAVFRKIGTQHMRSAFLVGGGTDMYEGNFTFRQQVMTLSKFRKGDINCLFTTSVAEEGLDVPDCNLVVRFDIYRTMIQYVQSRGRARQQNSKFIHVLEKDNSIHAQQVAEVRAQERVMQEFCQALPEDRRLTGNEDALETLLSAEKNLRVYTEPTTGAKLTYGNSLAYLANFVSAIPNETDEPMHPTYTVSSRGAKFISEVLLPGDSAPIRSAIGLVCTKKTLAKRSAAFEACIELRRSQKMNEHFMPVYQKRLPAMRNALLAVNAKADQYAMRTKPSIWELTRGTLPTELWLTTIDFPDGLEMKHQPLALLTRTRMPAFPTFPVFLNNGMESKVVSQQFHQSLQIEDLMLEKLSAFTFRVFRDVFSKTYEEEAAMLSYWLAPAARCMAGASPEAALDWTLLDEVFGNDEYRWTFATPNNFLVDKFLVDKGDGSRKFFSIAVDPELKPLDPVPDDTAKYKHQENILGYSCSLYKNARREARWNLNQPVIEAEKNLLRRNMLATPSPKETTSSTRAFICPEPLSISTLPTAVVVSCFFLPAIIHRFESYMIAIEACEMIGVECEPDVALAAMTKDSDNNGEHEAEERIHFQQGMGENYERLEFIGDTFLKTATTISTFIQNPNDNEFDFHVKRMLLLCNKNLLQVATGLGIHEFIRSKAFSRRTWYPEGLKLLRGTGVNKQDEASLRTHRLGDKTIADVSEALIGAAFVTHDRPGEPWYEQQWENAVHAVTTLVSNPKLDNGPWHAMARWNDYRAVYKIPSYQTGEATASQRDLARKVQLEHPYPFKYPRLLRSAFIHPSQPLMDERLPNYQRLEFLGDALLDMASITHIFYRFPDKDPQWLTEHKMAMVSNKFLGAVCVNIGFHRHLRYSSSVLEPQIRIYATELLEAKRTAGDNRDYWTTVSDPPKCLPDIVESYIGAMFIDSDFDYKVVQKFFDTHIKWYFEDMSIYDTFANNHPCTRLHKLLQTTYRCQDYRLMAKELPPADGIEMERKDVVAVVIVHNEIIACTKGKSGQYARVRVANYACKAVDGLVPFEFRNKYGCDCHLKGDSGVGEDIMLGEVLPADCGV